MDQDYQRSQNTQGGHKGVSQVLRALLPEWLKLLAKILLNKRGMRGIVKSHLLQDKQAHQISGDTTVNRYPSIFAAAQKLIEKPDARILSFGCSTGEEVLTLRQYFPQAQIIGSEIDAERLAICRSLPVDENCTFIDAEEQNLIDAGRRAHICVSRYTSDQKVTKCMYY